MSNVPIEVYLAHGTEHCQYHSQQEEHHQLQIPKFRNKLYSIVMMINIGHVTLLLPRLSSTGS